MDDPTLIRMRAGRAELGVAPDVGGSIAHYRRTDRLRTYDWLRPATAADLASGAADRMACYPLVPFSNRIRDGCFSFGKRAIRLPLNRLPERHARHGHGWQAAWQIRERADDRLTLEYDHAAGAWPFPYRARQDFVLAEEELRVTLSLENRGRETMPAGLGLHPYFLRTPRCRLRAQVDGMWATDSELMPTELVRADPRLGGPDGLPVADAVLDNAFTGWRCEATITWPECDARLSLVADPAFAFLVVYSPARAGFFCAEPVSHCTDAFNLAGQGRTDTGMRTLEPGATMAATVRFRPSLF